MRLFGRVGNLVSAHGGLWLTALAMAAVPQLAAAQSDVVLHPASASVRAGKWTVVSDSSAVSSKAMRHPDAGAAKITTALASPSNYFELTFSATAGIPYRLWVHGKADNNYWGNDSVFVQFAGSVTSSGSATWRIGTSSAAEVNIEECKDCGLRGWQWQDNGWGTNVLGPLVYFSTTGTQRMRVQTREDGLSMDQIVLSPSTYLKTAPGTITSTSTSTSTTSGTLLKVLTWNTHHGIGTDGVYNIKRIADWIVKTGANVVSLNEVEKYTYWGNENQPQRYKDMLESKTGRTWYMV